MLIEIEKHKDKFYVNTSTEPGFRLSFHPLSLEELKLLRSKINEIIEENL